jgi:hypothetical protein
MDDELKDLIKEQGRRGKRPVDLQVQKERKAKLEMMRKLLEIATEDEFVQAMRVYGLRDGSEEFLSCLEIWRGYRS